MTTTRWVLCEADKPKMGMSWSPADEQTNVCNRTCSNQIFHLPFHLTFLLLLLLLLLAGTVSGLFVNHPSLSPRMGF